MAFDFITLITDRTQQDVDYVIQLIDKLVSGTATNEEEAEWNSFTLKGAYNYTDLNRVTEAMEYLKDLLVSYGYSLSNYKRIRLQRPGHYETQTVTKPILPDAYTQLEYIKSSGTQYIDTGFIPNQDTRTVLNVTVSQTGGEQYLFGVRMPENALYEFHRYSNQWSIGYRNKWTDYMLYSGDMPFTIELNKNQCFFNGTLVGSGTYGTFTCSYSMYLFHCSGSTSYTPISASLYSCQIYDNNTLVRDFVPAKRISDGAIGLFDKLENKFYGNAGTGVFVAGPENVEYETITEEVFVPDERDAYTWFEDDIPTSCIMAQYITNLSELRSQFAQATTTPSVPSKMDELTWKEANNIEKILEDVYTLLTNIASGWFYSGELYAGEV